MSCGTLNITENSTVENNDALGSGGGIFASGSGSRSYVNITNSTILDNDATTCGGGICVGFAEINITNSVVEGNKALPSLYGGGGIYANDSIVNVIGSVISCNSATDGGGIRGEGSTGIDIDSSTIAGNIATASGSGIYGNSSTTTTVNNSTLTGNTANVNGGGMYICLGGEVTSTNSLIALNEAATDKNIYGSLELESADNLLDDNLAREIRQSVGISENGLLLIEHVSEAESLTLDSNAITTLEGLQNATSLESLSLVFTKPTAFGRGPEEVWTDPWLNWLLIV